VTASLTMALALIVGWAVVRRKFTGAAGLDALTFLPHSIPGIIIGISLVYLAFLPPFGSLRLFGGLTIIILGLTMSYIAFGSRTMISAVAQIHAEMEEAAMTSGARWRAVMSRIVVPLLLPAFIGGWIWVASHAFRNFSVPLVLTSRDNMLLSVLMWRAWDDGSPGQTSALGVLLIVALGLFAVAGRLLVSRLSRQQAT
jgi:iron(III) transport system permease protein